MPGVRTRADDAADRSPDDLGHHCEPADDASRYAAPSRRAAARHSVVPAAAGRNVWLAAVWTGAGTAVLGAAAAIAVVAVCWLPASHGSGNATSAIKAGLLTLLASVHGGITVNGVDAAFLPLGLTALLGLIAWRAGAGLADAAGDLRERASSRLLLIGAAQTAGFTVTCLLLVPFATLGTSSAPFIGVGVGAVVVFSLTGGLAFARETGLVLRLLPPVPAWVRGAVRAAAVGIGCYLVAGALLVAASLLAHEGRAGELLRQVGPGWNGAPIILLCLLAAPNAAIAGAAYVAGPGFAVGSGTSVGIGATTHGVVPSFPLLAALPTGAAPGWMWVAVIGVPVIAGLATGAVAARAADTRERFERAGVAVVVAALLTVVLMWQGGGGIGDGRLSTIGASPLMTGLAVGGELAAGALLVLAAQALRDALGGRRRTPVLWVGDAPASDDPYDLSLVVAAAHAPHDTAAEATSAAGRGRKVADADREADADDVAEQPTEPLVVSDGDVSDSPRAAKDRRRWRRLAG